MQKVLRKPSASMVVAILALVVATSGTAIAAGHLATGDKLIKKHSLSGNRLRNHTITGQQVNLSQLGKVPSAANADHATSADNATNATTAGSASISRLDYESSTVNLSTSGPVSGTANCPAGLNAVGGGAKVSDENNNFVNDTYPVGRTAWQATGFVVTSSPAGTMTVYVICAQSAHTTP
jgi:hypothetical protein